MILLFLVIWNYCQEPEGKDEQKDKGEASSMAAKDGEEDPAVRQKEVESEANGEPTWVWVGACETRNILASQSKQQNVDQSKHILYVG